MLSAAEEDADYEFEPPKTDAIAGELGTADAAE
jgi:hypothetical protein